jgi:hypothetical protein
MSLKSVKFHEQAIFPCEEFFWSSLWLRSLDQVFGTSLCWSHWFKSGSSPWIKAFWISPEMFFGIESLHQGFLDQVLGSGLWIKSLDQIFGSSPWIKSLASALGSSPWIKSLDQVFRCEEHLYKRLGWSVRPSVRPPRKCPHDAPLRGKLVTSQLLWEEEEEEETD